MHYAELGKMHSFLVPSQCFRRIQFLVIIWLKFIFWCSTLKVKSNSIVIVSGQLLAMFVLLTVDWYHRDNSGQRTQWSFLIEDLTRVIISYEFYCTSLYQV